MATQAALDGTALLAAIIAGPGDDAVRLIYADWCEENGQSGRAEFVRAQVALARRGCCPVYCERSKRAEPCPHIEDCKRLEAREQALWGMYTCAPPIPGGFAGSLDGTHPTNERIVTIRRGFVESVSCPLQAWLDHGPALVRAHPLTKVVLTDREPHYADTANQWIWYCRESFHISHPNWLEKQLFGQLAGGRDESPLWRSYDTEQDANAAASAAALKHAWGAACA